MKPRRRMKHEFGQNPALVTFSNKPKATKVSQLQWPQTKRATDEARTRGLHLGKVALYQLSYYRIYYFLPSDDLL